MRPRNKRMSARLLMVDYDDSFTFMLVDLLRVAGAQVRVVRASEISVGDAMADDVDGIILSPGPGHPRDAPTAIAIAAACISAGRPLLGICLGHQAIALSGGGTIRRVRPVHGMSNAVNHHGAGLFAGLPARFNATRYHSLAVDILPREFTANAWSDDGTIMGFSHHTAPIHGLQFHPESIASEYGPALVGAFVGVAEKGA
ncbi:anthranilate synthase component II [Sphingomonas sp. RB1R13]|uniref:anthranilate synthase component II n=1 Tax=Sphingomonas sp. RB1R13 TaxID=3096159 RepID=UPI002FCAC824